MLRAVNVKNMRFVFVTTFDDSYYLVRPYYIFYLLV